jgi:hypothetical protein
MINAACRSLKGVTLIMPAITQDHPTAIFIQRLIATVFFVLGGWCLVAPGSVIALTVRPEHQSNTLLALVTMGAFGAQACIAGLFAALSRFTHRTFAAYGISLLPFLVFDWWFYAIKPLFNELILLDVVGNVIMMALCWRGYRLLSNALAIG